MILLHAPAGNDVFDALKQRLNRNSSPEISARHTRPDDLFHRRRQPRLSLQFGVFAITNPADFDRLIAVRGLLSDMRLVLDVADDDPQTVCEAHPLFDCRGRPVGESMVNLDAVGADRFYVTTEDRSAA